MVSSGVHEYLNDLAKEEVWGAVTLNFEAGKIKTVYQNLVWRDKDLEAGIEPRGAREAGPAKGTARKRLIVRPGVSNGSLR